MSFRLRRSSSKAPKHRIEDFVVITGFSGAGKSQAMATSARPSPSRSAVAEEMMSPFKGSPPVAMNRLVQPGFSYQAMVVPPRATRSGRPSPLMSATST